MYDKIRMIEQTYEIEYNVKKNGEDIISENQFVLHTYVYKFGDEQMNDNCK